MGSYCIECGVSGQTIADGDRCIVVPILQSRGYAPVGLAMPVPTELFGVAMNTCHPDSFWTAFGGFVSGWYDDCGRVFPEDTPHNRLAMMNFFSTLARRAPVVIGEDDRHNVPFDILVFVADNTPVLAGAELGRWTPEQSTENLVFKELLDVWDYVWRVSDEHRLFCRDYGGAVRPVQFSVMHQIAFDHLVQYTGRCKNWAGESLELGAFLQRGVKDLTVGAGERTEEAVCSQRFFDRIKLIEHLTLERTKGVSGVLEPFAGRHFELLDRYLDGELSFLSYVEAMRPSMACAYAVYAMDQLNLKFAPVVYAGQDYDNSQGQAFAEFVASVSREVTQERKTLYEE